MQLADTGPVTGAAAPARVFDAFQRAGGTLARRHGGTGPGPAIGRNVAVLTGRGIEARSPSAVEPQFDLAARRRAAGGPAGEQ